MCAQNPETKFNFAHIAQAKGFTNSCEHFQLFGGMMAAGLVHPKM